MERELTLATLTLSACGPALVVCGAWLPPAAAGGDGRELERRRWARVWAPLGAALLPFAVLLGWSLQEPDVTGEAIGPAVRAVAVVFAAIWARALLRGVASLFAAHRRAAGTARTIGLLRPRIVIAPDLASRLDASQRDAVMAHEAAHARHRDPLRIWLAQIVTDLQWPLPSARARLLDWRRALEVARDEEARLGGIDGEDLASAILAAARAAVGERTPAAPLAEGDLADRIARLLGPAPEPGSRRRSTCWHAALAVAMSAAVVAGHAFGEAVFRALPGVQP